MRRLMFGRRKHGLRDDMNQRSVYLLLIPSLRGKKIRQLQLLQRLKTKPFGAYLGHIIMGKSAEFYQRLNFGFCILRAVVLGGIVAAQANGLLFYFILLA